MDDLIRELARMLTVFGQVGEDRLRAFAEAVRESYVCETCAARAARTLANESRRRPTPRDLLDAARELMRTEEHVQHATRPRSLPAGAWLASVGPAVVREAWPGISERELGLVMHELERQLACGALEPDRRALLECLGWEGKYGPTSERRWWARFLAARQTAG